jgi:acetate--CoA ligase
MITHALINPRSIAVIGGSNHIHKPGGRLVKNLIEGPFTGDLYIVNPKERLIQGHPVTRNVNDLPTGIELGVLAVSAAHCTEAVRVLVEEKGARAIIIISAGFSEESTEGAAIEREICRICTAAGAALIGPNCIGLANPYHHAVFTSPVPTLGPGGVDLISASGGVALFIIECALTKGLRFHSLWSVGNAAQTGIEEVLEYMDEHFDPSTDARIKALYIEDIRDAEKLVRHAASLVRKGCRIAAIKGGTTESGMRASAMHTGARPTSEEAVAGGRPAAGARRGGGGGLWRRSSVGRASCGVTVGRS